VLRLAARQVVEIDIVTNGGCGNDRVLLVLRGKLRKSVVRLGVDHSMFLDPANLVFLSLDLEEAAAMLQDFKLLPIDHLGHAIGYSGHTIMEVHLARGDVDRLMQFLVKTAASGKQAEKKQEQHQLKRRGQGEPEALGRGNGWNLRSREHSRWRSC
jgi:hypothetical protein